MTDETGGNLSQADLVLKDGREIVFDLDALTITEYRALCNPKQPKDEEAIILARVCGITVEEYEAIPFYQWRRLTRAFFEKASRPLSDPNYQSESTTT